MDRFLPVFSFLLLSVAASHAALPAQLYWHTVLPNTPMPTAIRDLLRPEALVDEKTGTTVNVGKGGVNVNTGYKKPGGGTTVNVGHGGVIVGTHKPGGGTNVNVGHGGVNVHTGYKKPGGGTNVNVGHGGVNVHNGYRKPGGGGTNVGVGHGGVNVNTGHKGKKPPVVVNVSPFIYKYAATETQVHDDPRVTLFFLEDNLHPGAKMTLRFNKDSAAAGSFLPRRVADSLPFSSDKAPEILARFSIAPDSSKAVAVTNTLAECEEPAADGESKLCATSLESMVDFATSSLATRNVVAVSTSAGKDAELEQEYSVAPAGVHQMAGSELVACHAETYAYPVFYCHATRQTKAYRVDLVGENGARVEAVAVCHKDTAGWNPAHVAFKVLKVKPGTVPVCHFLPQDHVVWAHAK